MGRLSVAETSSGWTLVLRDLIRPSNCVMVGTDADALNSSKLATHVTSVEVMLPINLKQLFAFVLPVFFNHTRKRMRKKEQNKPMAKVIINVLERFDRHLSWYEDDLDEHLRTNGNRREDIGSSYFRREFCRHDAFLPHSFTLDDFLMRHRGTIGSWARLDMI